MKNYLLLFLLSLAISTSSAEVKRFYVAPLGKTTGQGSLSSPFGTISQAVAAAAAAGDSVEILLYGGRYDISKTIEIIGPRVGSHLTIRPVGDEKVSISGGISLRTKDAQAVTDICILSRIQDNMKGRIFVIDLKKRGIPVAGLHPSGFGRPSVPAWTDRKSVV